ncbi:MAG TPA: TolC family protein, partial [Roseateles sp.]|nr:TolC family protein [Roseateles sp.]
MHRTDTPNPTLIRTTALWVSLACALLGGCAVGPDYVRPEVNTPARFKEAAATADKWQPLDAAAASAPVAPAEWWKIFNDPALDALEQELQINNQNILIAEAQYRAARAALDTANAAFYPTVNGSFGGTRAANAIVNNNNGTQSQGASSPNTTVNLSASASWELDVWGKIRRSSESAGAKLDASAAD